MKRTFFCLSILLGSLAGAVLCTHPVRGDVTETRLADECEIDRPCDPRFDTSYDRSYAALISDCQADTQIAETAQPAEDGYQKYYGYFSAEGGCYGYALDDRDSEPAEAVDAAPIAAAEPAEANEEPIASESVDRYGYADYYGEYDAYDDYLYHDYGCYESWDGYATELPVEADDAAPIATAEPAEADEEHVASDWVELYEADACYDYGYRYEYGYCGDVYEAEEPREATDVAQIVTAEPGEAETEVDGSRWLEQYEDDACYEFGYRYDYGLDEYQIDDSCTGDDAAEIVTAEPAEATVEDVASQWIDPYDYEIYGYDYRYECDYDFDAYGAGRQVVTDETPEVAAEPEVATQPEVAAEPSVGEEYGYGVDEYWYDYPYYEDWYQAAEEDEPAVEQLSAGDDLQPIAGGDAVLALARVLDNAGSALKAFSRHLTDLAGPPAAETADSASVLQR
jgi:hypothetical protein